MAQQDLRSERLTLVPLAEEQLPFLVELNSDPVVLRFLFTRALTPVETEERLHRWITEARGGLGMWVGYAGGEPIGLWMLKCPDDHRGEGRPEAAELGYRLPQRHWRQGFASEASRELIRHGFADLGLSRIYAETMAVNTGSRATMAKVGMRHVRTYHQEFGDPLPGTEYGEVAYEITREEWAAAAAPDLRRR